MPRWSDLQDSEFFGFFGVHETGRDGRTVRLQTGGFQEHIHLEADLGADDLRRFTLRMTRAWVDGAGAPFAKDIAKSFVVTLDESEQAVDLARRLWELESGNVVYFGDPPPPLPPAAPAVADALAAYQGRRPSAALGSFTIENRDGEVHITWLPR